MLLLQVSSVPSHQKTLFLHIKEHCSFRSKNTVPSDQTTLFLQIKEHCSKSANGFRTLPKTRLSFTNSLVSATVAGGPPTNSLMTKWWMRGVSLWDHFVFSQALQHTATHCKTTHYNIQQRTVVCCIVLQCVAVCCSVLQRIAVCNTLWHTL